MARDVIDDRLVGALHVRALTRAGLRHEAPHAHTVVQTGTMAALLDGHYDGDLRVGDLLARGDLGIGTIQHLDGELVILDGEAWVVHADGRVDRVAADTRTPFVVACRFVPVASRHASEPVAFDALCTALDELAPVHEPVVAVRVDGDFRDLRLRSVHAQRRPYPPLRDVVAHQTEWSVAAARGSVVGFRFPDASSGIEVPGYHLHFLSDDRLHAGHVLGLTLVEGDLRVDGEHELHVEVPAGIRLGEPGALASEIHAVEGGPDVSTPG
ncbi:MAG TPA: acetolactate decarboxylase [Acidimicrobiia bacterium]|nr:acetolactate decarboxylase [Acidimicrobiia bacterium]